MSVGSIIPVSIPYDAQNRSNLGGRPSSIARNVTARSVHADNRIGGESNEAFKLFSPFRCDCWEKRKVCSDLPARLWAFFACAVPAVEVGRSGRLGTNAAVPNVRDGGSNADRPSPISARNKMYLGTSIFTSLNYSRYS